LVWEAGMLEVIVGKKVVAAVLYALVVKEVVE